MLETADAVIEAVGGTTAAAELAGVGAPAVSNWKASGTIPSRHFFTFSAALGERGLAANRSIFGFRLEEARP